MLSVNCTKKKIFALVLLCAMLITLLPMQTSRAMTRAGNASHNLAYGKTATQSSTYSGAVASRAVDGSTNGHYEDGSVSHTNSQAGAWWQVDLGASYLIDKIMVYNRTGTSAPNMARLSDYNIIILDENQNQVWSNHQTTYPNPITTVSAGGETGRYVKIQLTGTNVLHMAEVEVYPASTIAPSNLAYDLAYGKTATQSSTYTVGAASRAVDGNTDGTWANGSVSHTNSEAGAWWQVDLGASYNIDRINVYNRTGSNNVRLSDYNIIILDEAQNQVWINHQTTYPDPLTTVSAGGIYGRYVKIQLTGTDYLHLAEVEVYQAVPTYVAEDTSFKFRFMAVSDVHTPNAVAGLPTILQESVSNGSSAICLIGDLTQDGWEAQYDTLMNTMNSNAHAPAYYVLGNHDVRWQPGGYAEASERYLTKTGMPAMHFDQWINGYHFIFLNTDNDDKDQASFTTSTLNWLDTTMARQADPEKPIFLFLHQPLSETIAGTYDQDQYETNYVNGVSPEDEFKRILSKYPQTFYISGHTHSILTDPGCFYNELYCNMINDGAIFFAQYTINEGLIIDVYGDRVVINGKEFTTQTAMNQWTVYNNNAAFDPNGIYKIINRNSGKTMNVQQASTADGASIIQYTYDGSADNERWKILDAGNGYYKLVNVNSNKAATIANASTADNALLIQNTDLNQANQQWIIKKLSNGYYKLINRNSGKLLDVPGGSLNNSVQLTQYEDKLVSNLEWGIVKIN